MGSNYFQQLEREEAGRFVQKISQTQGSSSTKKSWSWGPSIVVVAYIIILYSQLYTLTPMPPFIQPARSSPSKGMFMLTATLMFMFNVLLDSPVSRMAIMGDDGAGAVALTVPMIHKELRRRRKKN